MYLLDTDWVIQALANREPAAHTLYMLKGSQVRVSVVSIGEVYEGAFNSVNPRAHLARMRRFLDAYPALPISEAIMERFAEIRAFLRRQGQFIADFDILIAATAIHYGLTLLTFNLRHFQRVPDLSIYRPD